MRWKISIVSVVIAIVAFAVFFLTQGTLHEVRMYRFDPDDPSRRNVFKPELLIIEPGDRVKFISVDPGFNTRSIPEMIPEYLYVKDGGAEFWRSEYSQDTTVKFDLPGIYGYKCQLYYMTSGMAGMIIVKGEGWDAEIERMKNIGQDRPALERIRGIRQKGMGVVTFEQIWAEVEARRDEIEK